MACGTRLNEVSLSSFCVKVMGVVDVKHTQEHELTLEWDSSASNDMIADSTVALVMGIDKSPASVKCMFFPPPLLFFLFKLFRVH